MDLQRQACGIGPGMPEIHDLLTLRATGPLRNWATPSQSARGLKGSVDRFE
jgi:hypothetical protein